MKRFKLWLIRLLGGQIKVYVPHRVVEYNGLGRPFETSDWERLATMQIWGQEFFRYIAHQLQLLEKEERKLPITPDKDRDRIALGIRRAMLMDLSHLSDTAAAKVTDARNKAERERARREKGLNDHG